MFSILIADDEIFDCKGLEWIIQKNFPDIQILPSVSSGPELLRSVTANRPDLIFLDINMPGMNGLEALELLRLRSMDTSVILISAYSEFAYAQKALQLGAKDYLVKPIQRDTLVNAIEKQLQQHERQQRQQQNKSEEQSLAQNFPEIFSGKVMIHPSELSQDYHHCRDAFLSRKQDDTSTYRCSCLSDFLAKEYSMEQFQICCADLLFRLKSRSSFFKCWQITREYASQKELLQCVLQLCDHSAPEESKHNKYVEASLWIMRRQYMEALSLEQISEKIGITPFYLSRLFRQELDQNFVEILTDIRIENAVEQLYAGNTSVQTISSQIGYPNVNYFYKVFKKHTGINLGEFKDLLAHIR